ncbi:MAG: hypothetical protein AAF203_03640 [Pseudomonadota bacterium]
MTNGFTGFVFLSLFIFSFATAKYGAVPVPNYELVPTDLVAAIKDPSAVINCKKGVKRVTIRYEDGKPYMTYQFRKSDTEKKVRCQIVSLSVACLIKENFPSRKYFNIDFSTDTKNRIVFDTLPRLIPPGRRSGEPIHKAQFAGVKEANDGDRAKQPPKGPIFWPHLVAKGRSSTQNRAGAEPQIDSLDCEMKVPRKFTKPKREGVTFTEESSA